MSLGLLWSRAIARPVVTFAKRRPLGAVGALILLIMILVAVTAPLIAPFDPRSVHVRNKFADPGDVVEKTGERLWLGSDQLGRDTLSRLIYGTRISLYVSLISVSIGVTLGALLGIISAYFGGMVDLVLQRIVDALMAFPGTRLGYGGSGSGWRFFAERRPRTGRYISARRCTCGSVPSPGDQRDRLYAGW